jgi:hypothetical protein
LSSLVSEGKARAERLRLALALCEVPLQPSGSGRVFAALNDLR